MSPVEFKKTLCSPVDFTGQGPHRRRRRRVKAYITGRLLLTAPLD